MWTFDRFEPGAEIGSTELNLGSPEMGVWQRLFPASSDSHAVPPGLLVALMMKGYMTVISPRPPGNVHAGQKLHWFESQLTFPAMVKASYRCLAKEVRNDRRRLRLGAELARSDGTPLLHGELLMLWAA